MGVLGTSAPHHFMDFMAVNNFASRLQILSDLTQYKYVCKVWYNCMFRQPDDGDTHMR